LRAFVDAGGKGLDDIAVRAAHLIE
jgi:hypothetical protein